MISCRRPSNRSSRLTLPLGPSNLYFFSTAIHGIRRRSAASASRARVKDFSFTRSCWRAASQSCRGTIRGVFIPRCSLRCCMSFALFLSMCLSRSCSFLHCQRLFTSLLAVERRGRTVVPQRAVQGGLLTKICARPLVVRHDRFLLAGDQL